MPVTDADTKMQRLLELQMLFWRNPGRSLRTAEIAAYLGVTERTVRNYLDELSTSGRLPIYKEGWEWHLLEDARMGLLPVNLDLEEGTQLYLAMRLLARHSDEPNPTIRAALVKLISAMPPTLSGHLERLVRGLPTQADPQYGDVFRAIAYGWATRRVVNLEYHPLKLKPYRARFCPYLLEPSAIGYTVYAIGHSDPPGALRTYKLERITQAELSDETFDLPQDFDGLALLKYAWGVMYGEELQTVTLRFHRRVARRVKETIWHPSQTYRDLDDGGVEWSAQVGDWLEMLPWIRGWGGDVEVIAPEDLREELVKEARRLAAIYDIQPIPTYQLLWAKTNKDKTWTHPLICHMIDVAQVTLALWNEVLTESIRAQFADALGLNVDTSGRLIAFWAGLHDLGKASPAFQRKYPPAKKSLADKGLTFPPVFATESCPHGTLSADALRTLLEAETDLPRRLAGKVARAVGGHHGAWPHPQDLQALKTVQRGDDDWGTVRRDLLQVLSVLFEPPTVERLGATPEEQNTLLTLLSGLTSTADWIGSMEHYFPYAVAPVDPVHYAKRAAAQARRALKELGWIGWQPPAKRISFRDLFQLEPRPMQEAVIELADGLEQPALVIIEAPTGIGKTEAALYLADHWAHTCQQRGLYVAMPTMATSNQMFTRVQEVLRRRYPQSLVNLHLIHSRARWRDDMQSLRLETFDERQGGTVAAMAWFLPHKRSLLAPFGVGTVDQALLSVLQARHFFVRLFGLSYKTVIFDEVHAYDTYMSTIFQRLLGWLRAVGASVVILSATLPAQTRRDLLRAYTGSPDVPLPDVSYPAITWATEDQVGAVPLAAPEHRTVALEWIEREPEAIARRLDDELRDGGCAAVICNTVGRAQEVYKAIRDARVVPPADLILFHARFPFAWREQIEREVLSRFGKKGQRSQKAIVVATQVIEQSLDLDFDLMVSDLAPVDLILQRAGRLHRHKREARPASCVTPRLLIATPTARDGVPDLKRDSYVYERYVLLRSYLALQGREQIVLPDDTEALIKAVYADADGTQPPGDLSPTLVAALEEAHQRMQRHQEKEQDEAQKRLIAQPRNRRLMNVSEALLEEDKPELHRALQALTRLIPPGVSLVCLHQTVEGLSLGPTGGGHAIDLKQPPSPELTKDLSRYTITVTHRLVVDYFLAQDVPEGWREHPLLHNHRVAVFADGVCTLTGTPYILRLNRELGLEIEKEAK